MDFVLLCHLCSQFHCCLTIIREGQEVLSPNQVHASSNNAQTGRHTHEDDEDAIDGRASNLLNTCPAVKGPQQKESRWDGVDSQCPFLEQRGCPANISRLNPCHCSQKLKVNLVVCTPDNFDISIEHASVLQIQNVRAFPTCTPITVQQSSIANLGAKGLTCDFGSHHAHGILRSTGVNGTVLRCILHTGNQGILTGLKRVLIGGVQCCRRIGKT
mmetsp:Transcript_9840/g.21358  ORF Transcript_9840/g.21358 Transcript_9840/m.21358 type:complete len:215 (-) Transcript_9840:64-708(-)